MHKMPRSVNKTQSNWCKTIMEHQKLEIRLRRIKAILVTKMKKRIIRGYYSSNNFQDSRKEKLLKENMGYLLRVLFFNAFLLGT
jgi:hypothetical protein